MNLKRTRLKTKRKFHGMKLRSWRRFEPGVTAGLGLISPLGPGRIGADLRFQRGFSSWINPNLVWSILAI